MKRKKKKPPLSRRAWFKRWVSRLLDPWSVPHFMFGVVVALAGLAFHLSLSLLFFAMLAGAILWEGFEKLIKIKEPKGNAVADVILPLMSFWLTVFIARPISIEPDQAMALFVVAFILFAAINVAAWQARFDGDRDFLN